MADAKTTVPGSRNGGVRITLPGTVSVIWALIVASLTVATTYVYATKGELTEHAKLDAAGEAELRIRAAVTETEIKQHDKALEKLGSYVEAVDANLRTLMIEVEIPTRRIMRPKEK